MAVSVSWLAAVAMPCVATAVVVRLMMGPGIDDRPIHFSGRLTFDDSEQMIEHTFDVPEGVSRIDVALSLYRQDRRTVLDLGLRGPSGLRGWSGGREASIHISPLTATQGYLPGAIESGRWSVILGLPNIWPGQPRLLFPDRHIGPRTAPAGARTAVNGKTYGPGDTIPVDSLAIIAFEANATGARPTLLTGAIYTEQRSRETLARPASDRHWRRRCLGGRRCAGAGAAVARRRLPHPQPLERRLRRDQNSA